MAPRQTSRRPLISWRRPANPAASAERARGCFDAVDLAAGFGDAFALDFGVDFGVVVDDVRDDREPDFERAGVRPATTRTVAVARLRAVSMAASARAPVTGRPPLSVSA